MVVLRRKQAGICCVLIMALVITAGCAPAGEGSTSGAAGPGSSSVEAATKTDGDQTIYDCAGTRIGIPTQYLSQLIVSTDSAMSDNPEEGIGLISIREKASVEAAKTDFGEEEMGFLFSIQKLTRAGYEHYVCGGGDGCQAFARDGKYYYIFRTATDVQFYRSGGKIDTDSPDWKNWETLMDLGDTVQKDVIARNGLSAYSDQEFFDKEFTYSGNHAYVNYYPYVTVDGSKQEHETFVLSQPAGQGDGGIWCVERIYNEYGDVRPYYPSAELIGSFDVTAEEYYSRLQKECDAGSHADLLTPLGAAKWFVSTSGEYNDTPTSSSLESVTAPDAAYMDTNQEISRYVSMLMGGRSVDPEALLACAGGFGVDFSDEMLQKARQRSDKIRWIQRDCSQPLADLGKFDLVFSNAFLQWLPNQEDFLASIVSLLNENGLFAVQVPNYDHMPVKHCVDKAAALFGRLVQNQDLTVCHNRCLPEYYDILCEHYGEVTIWKTDYVHVLDDHQSIVDFVSATGIRPYLQVLDREEQSAFVQALLAELEQAYPTRKNGKVLFAFERIEFLAKR